MLRHDRRRPLEKRRPVTLESALPYLSVAAALAAGVAAREPGSARERALKTLALAALALFSYFRGIAPTEVPAALALGAIAESLTRPGVPRWRAGEVLFRMGSRLVFAYLFLRIGEGRAAFLGDAIKAGLLVVLLAAGGFWSVRMWSAAGRERVWAMGDAGALLLMAVSVLTLYWSFWPAMAGALAVLASEGLLFASAFSGRIPDSHLLRRSAWVCGYLGQTAMAYAFLR